MKKGIFELIAWMADLFLCCSTNSQCIALVESKLKRSIRMPSLINCTNCIEQKNRYTSIAVSYHDTSWVSQYFDR